MNTYADKTQEIQNRSAADGASKMEQAGGSVFQFVNNRPEAVSQRKLQEVSNQSPRAVQMKTFQEMANNGPRSIQMKAFQETANNGHQEKRAVPSQRKANENVVQRVEAGAQPIRVNSGDQDNNLTINGLINCVGVVIMIYGEGAQEFDYVAVVGGHFVTPEMYRFGDAPGFTEAGEVFLANIQELINGISAERLETTYYVKAPAVVGANPESLVQATEAATAIKGRLGLGGSIQQTAEGISVFV